MAKKESLNSPRIISINNHLNLIYDLITQVYEDLIEDSLSSRANAYKACTDIMKATKDLRDTIEFNEEL